MSKTKTYHNVIVISDGSNLISSDLFINDLEGAKKHFVEKIKGEDPTISENTLDAALDEGWCVIGTTVVIYTEPYNIFGKE